MKTNLRWLSVVPLAAVALSTSCGRQENLTTGARLMSETARPKRIGEASDEGTARFLDRTCLNVSPDNIEVIPPKLGKLKVQASLDSQEILDTLGAEAQISYSGGSINLEGRAKFSKEMEANEYSSNLVYSFEAENGYVRIKDMTKVTINEMGKQAINEESTRQGTLAETCGTRFVKGKQLKAQFVAVLKMSFRNRQQKEAFDGFLKAQVSSVAVEGSVKLAAQQAARSASFSLDAFQYGGNGAQIANALNSTAVMGCILKNNADQCGAAMATIVEYGKAYAKSLEGNDGAYWESDEDFGIYKEVPGWHGEPPTETDLLSLRTSRARITDMAMDEQGNFIRTQALVKNSTGMTDDQLDKIRSVQEMIHKRINLLSLTSQQCYGKAITQENVTKCAEAVDKAAKSLRDEPEYRLDKSVFVVIPASFMDWCSTIKNYHDVLAASLGANGTGSPLAAELVLNANARSSIPEFFKMILSKQEAPYNNRTLVLEVIPKDRNANLSLNTDTLIYAPELRCNMHDLIARTEFREVNLSDKKLTNFDAISMFSYATKVDISGGFNVIEDMMPFTRLPFLSSLTINGALIRASNLDLLRDTALIELHAKAIGLKADGFMFVAPTRSRERVNLLEKISGWDTLEVLDLDENEKLADLDLLKNMKYLREIHVRKTSLSAASVERLMARKDTDFPGLEVIYARNSPACSQSGASILNCVN